MPISCTFHLIDLWETWNPLLSRGSSMNYLSLSAGILAYPTSTTSNMAATGGKLLKGDGLRLGPCRVLQFHTLPCSWNDGTPHSLWQTWVQFESMQTKIPEQSSPQWNIWETQNRRKWLKGQHWLVMNILLPHDAKTPSCVLSCCSQRLLYHLWDDRL